MASLETELEKAWQDWKRQKAKHLVKGEFPQAKALLKQRKRRGLA